MKNFLFSLVLVTLLTACILPQEKIINNLPENIESIYVGVTTFGFYYHENGGGYWVNDSKVRLAIQTKYELPIGTVRVRSMHDFVTNATATQFTLFNQWGNFSNEIGYKSLPMTFMFRGNPFTAAGQFEYAAMQIIPGAAPSINFSYKLNSLTAYAGFGERFTARKVAIPEGHFGLKLNVNDDIEFKVGASKNKDVSQYASSLSIYNFSLMVGADNLKKQFGYIDWKLSDNVGHLYVDYVRDNKQDSYLEFGQYWDKDIYKDITASIGYGYNPTLNYFYLYSFIHI